MAAEKLARVGRAGRSATPARQLQVRAVTALTAHIRALRAEADGFKAQADALNQGSMSDADKTVLAWLLAQSSAKRMAADTLQAQEDQLNPPLEGAPGHQHARYDPKGKRPSE